MKIDKQTVDKIAHLARLELTEAEEVRSIEELSEILSFMEKLNELDTTGVEPLVYMSEEQNVFRDDIAGNELSRDEALKNAPGRNDTYFTVARVIPKK